ncbi:hypothetical protein BIU82_12170 [Arthrobacter sp. SW1]|uniref:hypothetical protein n=1 Tax=Arthrobacter sp. SW1 TaxID=1920889 RepID=UPI000877DF0B|nr:hypothetical protein [Arthrobacter sp. SW1]OFI36818.1 hypothetical protein BIU82_12170 [Arthrobacter sp. SW1]
MQNVRELIRPSKEEWASLPRRRSGVRPTLMAWLLGLLTVGGAFVADTGWDDAAPSWEESLHPMSVLVTTTLVVASMFAVGGWSLGRNAVYFLPVILLPCSVLAVGGAAPSAFVWVIGLGLACALAVLQLRQGFAQLEEIRRLALRLSDGTRIQLGDNALASERRAFSLERWSVLGLVALSVVFWVWFAVEWTAARAIDRPSEGSVYASVPPVFGLLATLLALLFAVRTLWHRRVWQQACAFVWLVPDGIGPVWAFPSESSFGGRLKKLDSQEPECTCREEAARREPDDDGWDGDALPANDYCPVHGIDALNRLSHDEFRRLARSEWPWDNNSELPDDPALPYEDSGGLLGFAGHVFGGIQVFRDGSKMDAVSPKERAAEHRKPDEGEMQGWTDPDSIPPSEQGILDTIDLAPVGLTGTAVRYRHGRAWLRTEESKEQ